MNSKSDFTVNSASFGSEGRLEELMIIIQVQSHRFSFSFTKWKTRQPLWWDTNWDRESNI